jgi:ABC-type Mn2+/Zn2+ transport system ATPase subunit
MSDPIPPSASKEPATELLSLTGGALGYPGVEVLQEVNLQICEGDFLGLVGPNGSGKTTLLKTLLGALPLRGGGLERAQSLQTLGYVPQRHSLDSFFPISVFQCVLMGRYGLLSTGALPSSKDRERALHALEQVAMLPRKDALYRDLSGGQQQRVLIARALASASRLLLLDEPTNGMDLPSQAEIMNLIRNLHHQDGLTVVLVTHDLQLVAAYANRLAILRDRVLHVGSLEEILNSEVLSRTYGVPVEVLRLDHGYLVRVQSDETEDPQKEVASC